MKKLLIVLAVMAGLAYQYVYHKPPFARAPVLADAGGNAMVLLATGPQCAEHCERIRDLLKQRGIPFEELAVVGEHNEAIPNKYDITVYPTTLIGQTSVRGDDMERIKSALAETYGKSALSRAERMAMDGHFDAQDRPRVVLYGTSWCAYCKDEREFLSAHGIPFEDIDVEASDAGALSYHALDGNGYPLTYVGYRRFVGANNEGILAAFAETSKTQQANVR
ncbi:MAG: glutaredoxin domain-containing protein [Pseudomonadota bacterium]